MRQSIGANFRSFVGELKTMTPPVTLARFLHDAAVEAEELYRSRGWSWTRLKREAGHADSPQPMIADSPVILSREDGEGPPASGAARDEQQPPIAIANRDEQQLLNALTRLLHMDSSGSRLRAAQRAWRFASTAEVHFCGG